MKFFTAVPLIAFFAAESLAGALYEADSTVSVLDRGLGAPYSHLDARQDAVAAAAAVDEEARRRGGNNNNNNGRGGRNNNNNGRGGNNNNNNNNNNDGFNRDPQKSLVLLKNQVQSNLAKDGQSGTVEAGQVRSLTSTNNFINFCASQRTSLTNGLQTKGGSCNPTPMGRIIATDKFVSSKFTFPKNTDTIKASQTFTIRMAIKNMVTGNFVNPQTNYYAAPCQVDGSGTVIGHSHVVIEKMTSLTQTEPTNPNVFAFFKGLNGRAQGGVLTADVTGGLAPGVYRLGSINACANHQPVLGAVAQHGIFDDVVYFTVQ